MELIIFLVSAKLYFTICVSTGLVLVSKLALPEYIAVMLCVPIASDGLASVAVFPESVPVPRLVAPSKNITVPVLVPDAGDIAETVAVNVTDW